MEKGIKFSRACFRLRHGARYRNHATLYLTYIVKYPYFSRISFGFQVAKFNSLNVVVLYVVKSSSRAFKEAIERGKVTFLVSYGNKGCKTD